MYYNNCHHYQWYYPMQRSLSNNYGGYNPHYYNWYRNDSNPDGKVKLRDYGPSPLVVNID